MWNLEKWYRWSYLQSRNKNTDENKHGHWEVGEMNWKVGTDIYIYTIDTEYKVDI